MIARHRLRATDHRLKQTLLERLTRPLLLPSEHSFYFPSYSRLRPLKPSASQAFSR